MSELADVKLGDVGDIKLAYEAGKLSLAVSVGVSVDQILSMVENAIPGDLDNKLIDGLKAILAKV